MKIILFALGFAIGAFTVHYHDNAAFAREANAKISATVDSAAVSAHQALGEAAKK